jgi:hypothetical protein
MNSNNSDKKGLLSGLPTKSSRVVLQFVVTAALGIPALLVFLKNLKPDLISSIDKEEITIAIAIALFLIIIALLISFIFVVKHSRKQDQKIKSLERGLKTEQAISMMEEIAKINRSL